MILVIRNRIVTKPTITPIQPLRNSKPMMPRMAANNVSTSLIFCPIRNTKYISSTEKRKKTRLKRAVPYDLVLNAGLPLLPALTRVEGLPLQEDDLSKAPLRCGRALQRSLFNYFTASRARSVSLPSSSRRTRTYCPRARPLTSIAALPCAVPASATRPASV